MTGARGSHHAATFPRPGSNSACTANCRADTRYLSRANAASAGICAGSTLTYHAAYTRGIVHAHTLAAGHRYRYRRSWSFGAGNALRRPAAINTDTAAARCRSNPRTRDDAVYYSAATRTHRRLPRRRPADRRPAACDALAGTARLRNSWTRRRPGWSYTPRRSR